jgi:hypothetical protein
MTQPIPTSPDTGRETRVVTVCGRSIVIRKLLDSQLLFLTREAQLLQLDTTPTQRKIAGVRRVFDALESQVVQDTDREFLMDQMAAGTLEFQDLMSFIQVFFEEETAESEKPKVRRGRRPAVR